ncbi:hypothetical protein MPTK1_7g02530 [Marchantia polymorpha subsp. ruderalis]|uniref:Bifunctional inhibitor/plant lipid transfer protein/seed storage helical domain-containing protein n=2 Tax=Marchantia polymorpha TaxID=3197 RepID=A0AAF6BVE8_MARPO|nr:hypothetical protein MARPO_0088s0035 [Marchantia polymorpha]BBN15982.1 hypothetical protein Mp_7g02530 [Marchantia polymorpha subsp. ruderalis]|eukprot:PTQ33489.1 hypothetical protein MARPO_0088s0035 [Marchantia polymorpha]
MAKLNSLSVTLVSVLLLGLCVQFRAVHAQCTRECNRDFIKQGLVGGKSPCLAKQDIKEPCPLDGCCYSLGTLYTVADSCICQFIKENGLNLSQFMQLFRKCGGRLLKC